MTYQEILDKPSNTILCRIIQKRNHPGAYEIGELVYVRYSEVWKCLKEELVERVPDEEYRQMVREAIEEKKEARRNA